MSKEFVEAPTPHEALLDPESTESAENPAEKRMEEWSLIQLDWAKMMCAKLFPKLSKEDREGEEMNWLIDDTHSNWFRRTFKEDPKQQGLIEEYKKEPLITLEKIVAAWESSRH